MECEESFVSLQMNVNDNDRKISSMKHPEKTLARIKEIDAPYLFWVAVKSKMDQPDRYACARVFIGSPYFIPVDGTIIAYDDLYQHFVKKAVDFIKENGGSL